VEKSMTLYKVFYDVLADLADLFDAESRIGGHEAAQELRAICSKVHTPLLPAHQVLTETIEQAITIDPLPIAAKIAKVMPLIDWHSSGMVDGRIRPEISEHLATAELVGPDGMIYSEHVRVGLFVQSPNLNYVTRKHAAEETFIILGGSAYWQVDGEEPVLGKSGDMIFHPSNTPHATITKDEPFISAWRWTGDVAYDQYTLTG
jgi:mannose-6-phosphate isomerase-like protein (cupin superfamily)